jgi:hypothetical protein
MGSTDDKSYAAKMHKRAFVVAVTVIMVVVPALAGCGALSALSGCTSRDELLAGDLAKLAVLDQRPPGAEPAGQWSGCDTDSGFAYAGRNYRSDLDRDQIIAFYHQAVPPDGWTLTAQNPPSRTDAPVGNSSRLCFDKDVNGTTAHLGLSFPSDLNRSLGPGEPGPSPFPHDVFDLEVTASHDGGAWC